MIDFTSYMRFVVPPLDEWELADLVYGRHGCRTPKQNADTLEMDARIARGQADRHPSGR